MRQVTTRGSGAVPARIGVVPHAFDLCHNCVRPLKEGLCLICSPSGRREGMCDFAELRLDRVNSSDGCVYMVSQSFYVATALPTGITRNSLRRISVRSL